MKLSTKAKYGLKACFVLALHYGEPPMPLTQVDRETGVSLHYLEQLFIKLKKAGIVVSTRGAAGGYALTEEPKSVTIGRVMRALEGDLDVVECLSSGACTESGSCPTRVIWKRLSDGINQIADGITLQDMVDDYKGAQNG